MSRAALQEDEFDPVSDLLVASRDKPSDLASVNLRTLQPYQRALLVTDGTVTRFIEAFMMEPVDVTVLSVQTTRLSSAHPWLELPAGSSVTAREVILRGRHSQRFYSYAVSLLVPNRFPEEFRTGLETNPGGIGGALQQSRSESRREILWYGRETLRKVPATVKSATDGRFLSRTYRIIAGAPFALINERFPMNSPEVGFEH